MVVSGQGLSLIALLARFWYLPVIAILVAFTGLQQMRIEHAQAKLSDYKLVQAQAAEKAAKDAREREQAMQDEATQITEAKDEQIRIIGDQLDTALASLRNRPERPAGHVPKASGSCKGATGANLSRPDAEFLTRESARADRLRSALDACYRQYDSLTPKG